MGPAFPKNLSPVPLTPIKGDRTISTPSLSGGFIDGFALSTVKKGFTQAILRHDDAATIYYQIATAQENRNIWLLGAIHSQNDNAGNGSIIIYDATSGVADSPGAGTFNHGNIRLKSDTLLRVNSPAVMFLPYPVLISKGIRVSAAGTAGNLQFITIYYMIEDK